MGQAIRARDWSKTVLGAAAGWPAELKIALANMLASPQAMFLCWGEDLTFFFNDAYRPILGERLGTALGRPARELWADIWSAVEPFKTIAMSGKSARAEDFPVTVTTSAGPRETWWSFIYSPSCDASGTVQGFLGTVTETTAQALARKRVAAERDQQLGLLRQMPGFVALLNGPEFVHEYANDAYVRISAGRDVLGLTVRQALPELEGQGLFEELDKVFATGEPFRAKALPVSLMDPAEEGRFIDLICEPVRDERGLITGIFAGGYDVTDRVRAETALAASEAEFRTFAQAMPNHVWAATPEGLLDWFNDRISEYSGLSPSQLEGQGWTTSIHPDDVSRVSARWAASLKTGEPYEAEIRLRRGDGVYRWHLGQALPIRDADGRIVRWIGNNTDIEDQKATGQALAHLNATLEQRVEERTTALMAAEEALRQSQKMEAVGQLTGGIAHDFNNMLAVVIGSLDLLGRRLAGEDQSARRHIDAATESAKRAALLTQRLLAFARQQPLRPESVDLNQLVAGMSDLLGRSIGGDIRLETALADGLWRAHVDPNQFESVILNLSVNSRDAMPDGGKLRIATHNVRLEGPASAEHFGLPAGEYVLIAVADSGSGMPADIIAKAFDPFFTTKDVGKGTGLGLSQVYGLVKQSGGHVKIHSEPGRGTTVNVYLPRFSGPDGETPAGRDEPATAPATGGRELVLVVEDEAAVRQFSIDALGELGYRVLAADGAAQALALIDRHPEIDLLFTDVIMPDVNGLKLAEEALRRRPGLKVLFTTGYTRAVVDGGLKAGLEMLDKPFTVEQLAAKVRATLTPLRPTPA